MLNKYPWWKNLLIVVVILIGVIYALPNAFAPDPAIQISGESSSDALGTDELARVEAALEEEGIGFFGETVEDGRALIRLQDKDLQLRSKAVAQRALGDGYVVALNLAETTPAWLTAIGAQPMKLGLDLSGGVHFLLEVDTATAIQKRLETYTDDFKKELRQQRIRGIVSLQDDRIVGSFASEALRDQARDILRESFPPWSGKVRKKGTSTCSRRGYQRAS